MGCNQTETDDFDKINKGYDSLIKSVKKDIARINTILTERKIAEKKGDN